jgi:RNA polymerase sigma-70 factor (ECF subfamily)
MAEDRHRRELVEHLFRHQAGHMLAQLLALAPSPVVALNRAIAQSMVDGPEAALASLDELSEGAAVKSYRLVPAVRADLLRRLGRTAEAGVRYREALTYPCTEPERRFLRRRIEGLMADAGPA